MNVAMDPERMRVVLAQHLRAPDGPPVEVVACKVGFTRSREPRSLFEYHLTLRDPADGCERAQVVSGITYRGQRTRLVWQKLRQQHPAPSADGAALVRAAYVPELDLLLQVFPFDHQLSALEPLMAGPLPGLLGPLLAQFGPGEWQLIGWGAEVMRYRIDLRACVRLTVHAREAGTGETAQRHFFAKIYGGEDRAERAWSVQRDVAAPLAAGDAPLATAPLVAYLPEARLLVQGEVPGTALSEVLRTAEAVPAVGRTARALACLHRLEVAAPAHRVTLGRSDLQRLRHSAEQLRVARPELASMVAEIEAGILTRLEALDELPAIPIHGDLKPGHVLLDGDRVVLLDLDKFAAGEPMLDVTHLLFHLRRGGSSVTRAFVEEYFGQVPAAWEPRLAPHYAWDLLTEASTWAESERTTREESNADRARHESRLTLLLTEAHAGLAGRPWWTDSKPSPWMLWSERRAVRQACKEERRVSKRQAKDQEQGLSPAGGTRAA